MEGGERSPDGKPEPLKVCVADDVTIADGLVIHVTGPDTDGIRVADSRGWTAASDIKAGVVQNSSATGKPSEGEDLTLETAEILVRRLNRDHGTWSDPVLLPDGRRLKAHHGLPSPTTHGRVGSRSEAQAAARVREPTAAGRNSRAF